MLNYWSVVTPTTEEGLAYQLHERIHFIAPKDEIVASMILNFADLVARQYTLGEATHFYFKAIEYNPYLQEQVFERLSIATYVPKKHLEMEKHSGRNTNILLSLITIFLAALICFKLLRK